jgi:hypothetical protein
MLESVVEMICDGLLDGALSSSQLDFVILVSNNSTNIGLVYRSIIANGITYPWL